jgi:3-phenylpropionate/cinnamic acid dioxygenase small subunit
VSGNAHAGHRMTIELHFKILDLNARYVHAIDDDRLEQWPDFFTDDGRYRITTAENVARGLPLSLMSATSRAMMRDRVNSLRNANVYESQRYRHTVGAMLIEPAENGIVRTVSNFLVARIMHTGETMLFATGRYEDRIAVASDGLRFVERTVILDSRQIDTLLAIPL